MPDVPVTLTPWFDAKDNPPEAGRVVLTDEGMARSWPSGRVWEFDMPDMEGPCNPTVWCDPSPPDMSDPHGALTVEGLTRLLHLAVEELGAQERELGRIGEDRFGYQVRSPGELRADQAHAVRLRRALDQIEATP